MNDFSCLRKTGCINVLFSSSNLQWALSTCSSLCLRCFPTHPPLSFAWPSPIQASQFNLELPPRGLPRLRLVPVIIISHNTVPLLFQNTHQNESVTFSVSDFCCSVESMETGSIFVLSTTVSLESSPCLGLKMPQLHVLESKHMCSCCR